MSWLHLHPRVASYGLLLQYRGAFVLEIFEIFYVEVPPPLMGIRIDNNLDH